MPANSSPRPPPLPRPPGLAGPPLLFVLVGVALAGAVTLAALVWYLRPAGREMENISVPTPAPTNPDAPVLATELFLGADDFVVDVFHNGRRVLDGARSMSAEVYGAIGERTRVTVRAGDWLVFNVVNNRLRWGGACYFGAAGVDANGAVTFVSEEGPQWSVCEEPGLVPRFIADPNFLSDRTARRIEKPWAGGDKMITNHVSGWTGHALWGSPTNRNVWIKYRAPERR